MNRRDDKGLAVPTGRLNRMARLGGLGTALAGSVAVGGVRAMASGRRPRIDELLLTPANAARVADQLARMRGAAMKVGQLLSMEARDILPDELALILERLRKDARFMPPAQLKTVLAANWGRDFMRRFTRFDVRPVAAASIGQVHRAKTRDGRDLAIKVQYPGIRASIDSDIRNLGMILKGARLLPDSGDIDRLLSEARAQLHEEANYAREADAQERFANALVGEAAFLVPRVYRDFCTSDILATDFIASEPIEALADKDPVLRDRVANRLLALVLHELLILGDMQTDPNFANYRYQPETDRIVLLDFGATRRFAPELVSACHRLLQAGVAGDGPRALGIMAEIGLIAPALPERDRALLLALFDMAAEPLRAGGLFDPARSDLLARLRAAGLRLAGEQEAVHVPPADTLLLQRKVLGSYLLAERLKARIDMGALLAPYLGSVSVADPDSRAGAR
jgi:predicted unusual protein kinase regulating ubiquinone biosynthesis (AarF/ABC1/UbiB family)